MTKYFLNTNNYICKNIFFVIVIILSQVFLFSAINKNIKLLQVSLQLGADGATSNNTSQPNSTQSGNNTTLPSQNSTMDDSKNKLDALEKAIKEQANFYEDVKKLLNVVDHLSFQMNETENKHKQILASVEDLKELYRKLDYKLTSTSFQTDNKLNQINTKLVKQLKNQLSIEQFNLQSQIKKAEDEVQKFDLKIKNLKSKIPNAESVCTMYNSCVSCSTNPGCGWCSMSQQCVDGNEKGPKDGVCNFYEYASCSGPRDCESYNDCSNCITDISCGWCNNAGSPQCMTKENADKGECSEDRYIHLWRSLNDNFKGKLLKDFKNEINLDEKREANMLDIDPEEKKKMVKELTVYQAEMIKKEVELDKLKQILNKTEEQIKSIDESELKFNLIDVKEDKDKFNQISKSVYVLLKDYIDEFTRMAAKDKNRKLSNITDLDSNQTEDNNSNTTINDSNMTINDSNMTINDSNMTINDSNITLSDTVITNITNLEKNTTSAIDSSNSTSGDNLTVLNATDDGSNSNDTAIALQIDNDIITNSTIIDPIKQNVNITIDNIISETVPESNITDSANSSEVTDDSKSYPESSNNTQLSNSTSSVTSDSSNTTSSESNSENHNLSGTNITNLNKTSNDSISGTSDSVETPKVTKIVPTIPTIINTPPTNATNATNVLTAEDLSQIGADFEVEPETFRNSLIQKKSDFLNIKSNLRNEAKLILL